MSSFPIAIALAVFAIIIPPSAATGYDFYRVASDSYDRCVYDPESRLAFQLLDSKSYFPLAKSGGNVVIANDSVVPEYSFSTVKPPGSPNGIYDITYDADTETSYLALYKTGHFGWASESSNGQKYIKDAQDNEFVTTLFSVTCTGRILAGMQNGPELALQIDDLNQATLNPDDELSNPFRTNRGFVINTTPPAAGRLARRDEYSRCPSGQTAIQVAPQSVPNGCGRADWFDAPDLNFGECCNGHDYCFDTCPKTFQECNTVFYNCMSNRCDKDFPSWWDTPQWLACEAAASTYAAAARSGLGFDSFMADIEVHCQCV